jgi:hypothetical protein
MYAQVVKKPSEGGTCGLKISVENQFTVGDTINVQWRADAPFLTEPYRGADAFETKDGFMAAQVTTFDPTQLKMNTNARLNTASTTTFPADTDALCPMDSSRHDIRPGSE